VSGLLVPMLCVGTHVFDALRRFLPIRN